MNEWSSDAFFIPWTMRARLLYSLSQSTHKCISSLPWAITLPLLPFAYFPIRSYTQLIHTLPPFFISCLGVLIEACYVWLPSSSLVILSQLTYTIDFLYNHSINIDEMKTEIEIMDTSGAKVRASLSSSFPFFEPRVKTSTKLDQHTERLEYKNSLP